MITKEVVNNTSLSQSILGKKHNSVILMLQGSCELARRIRRPIWRIYGGHGDEHRESTKEFIGMVEAARAAPVRLVFEFKFGKI